MVSSYGLDISWFLNISNNTSLPETMFRDFFKLLDII